MTTTRAGGDERGKPDARIAVLDPLSAVSCRAVGESLVADSLEFVTDSMSESALASLLTEFFLHKSFGMLNAPLRRLSQSHAPRKRGAPHAVPKTRMR